MSSLDKDPKPVLEASGWNKLFVPQPTIAKYAITGYESQIVTVSINNGDSVKGEPGVMMYLTPGMTQRASCDGCFERLCSGEECCVMNFINEQGGNGYVAMTPNFPMAKVVPIDLSSPEVGGTLIAQQGAFMASYGDVRIGISLDCNFLRCCCAGTGLVRQKIEGSGTVFLAATGTIIQKVLAPGETIIIDTNCILAFSNSCQLDLKRAGGILGMVGGGEGIFNTTLTGPGLCFVQSMNETTFREALVANKIYRR
eukprot:CAMPEP_0202442644 /NCGR_PEP_ID=MMETSP1360-20130828/2032_1 /ASSEMBLY_ACC=CAM_ASM_000848 /TAXON_ID=515479 /ORGANISM="Licmophora paradoxa, Strain CCMP2313" /LENGTH=254 /DNA_ID=CAMNT_0049058063 /DNA_START=20 /DNA_END=784 /DNA_ORIENTATION=-